LTFFNLTRNPEAKRNSADSTFVND